MDLPAFIRAFPALDLPLPDTAVSANAMQTGQGLAVFFTFHEDVELPAHSHGAREAPCSPGRLR
ncbi:hypothetical protein [Rhodovulum sp. 12E13]|uniref:hypothetical protein n=1 Tax=Rhodovulum sp. 12E13 TaxID=2203891 RepID=UPI001F310D3E|nr:hypothetical protein [Rhodovulum sp. 12E13]